MPYTKKELEKIVKDALEQLGKTTNLTDFNVGSVARTLIESISNEIYILYQQLDKVYESGFIDTASGKALDEAVKILGVERDGSQSVKRKEPNPASGMVIFGRNAKPTMEVTIPHETRVATRRRTYCCPVCNEVLFRVPYDEPIPKEKVEMVCKNGHKVRVPKFEL